MQEDEIELNQWSNKFVVIEAIFIYITDPFNIWLHQFISKNVNYQTELKNIKLKPLIIRPDSILNILNVHRGFFPQQIVWKLSLTSI